MQGALLPASRLEGYGRSAAAAERHVEEMCTATPWGAPSSPNFTAVTRWEELAPATRAWSKPCGCVDAAAPALS